MDDTDARIGHEASLLAVPGLDGEVLLTIGECRQDEEIMIELARRMELEVGTESLREVLDAQLASVLGISFDELAEVANVGSTAGEVSEGPPAGGPSGASGRSNANANARGGQGQGASANKARMRAQGPASVSPGRGMLGTALRAQSSA